MFTKQKIKVKSDLTIRFSQYGDIYIKIHHMDKGKIYKITNILDGKIYIGCTVNSLEKRFYEHLYRCYEETQRKPTHFSRWMNLVNNFV